MRYGFFTLVLRENYGQQSISADGAEKMQERRTFQGISFHKSLPDLSFRKFNFGKNIFNVLSRIFQKKFCIKMVKSREMQCDGDFPLLSTLC